jgi:hypothetical protein
MDVVDWFLRQQHACVSSTELLAGNGEEEEAPEAKCTWLRNPGALLAVLAIGGDVLVSRC